MDRVRIASFTAGVFGDLHHRSITNLTARNKWVVNFLWSGGISSMPIFKRANEGEV